MSKVPEPTVIAEASAAPFEKHPPNYDAATAAITEPSETNGAPQRPTGVLGHDPVLIQQMHARGEISPGVARIMSISSVITQTDRVIIFLSTFLVAYAYGLDGTIRYFYQTYATSSFGTDGQHSLLSTVNVLRSVIAAAAQPTSAKIADVFGRVELISLSVFFYILGTIIEASSKSTAQFAAGAVIYQVGYTMIMLLVEVVIADITSTRARLFFSYIPALPFIINTWASAEVVAAVLKVTTWNWGIGMWCIIYFVCALPLIFSLAWVGHKAKKQGLLASYKTPFQEHGFKGLTVDLFWQLDVVGIILLIAVFGLILAPLTVAGGLSEKWRKAEIIVPLVLGFVCIPIFGAWEVFVARHPMIPFKLLRRRTVWAAMGVACLLNFCWYMQGDYLYTVLQVAFEFSLKGANRVTQLYSFVSVITGALLGLVVYKVRRVKWFAVFGTCLFMVAFGLLIRYRGGSGGNYKAGAIAAQVVLGFAGGLFPYPVQAMIQSVVKHEHVAIVTGIYLATYNIGSALGAAVSGAIWTQVLPKDLERRLAFMSSQNSSIAAIAYGNPLGLILEYPMGTPVRQAMVESYRHVQRLLCITGICIVVPLIAFTLLLEDIKLNDHQNLVEDEDGVSLGSAESSDTSVEGKEPQTNIRA